jgi:predicted nuclease with TOPRIM domain
MMIEPKNKMKSELSIKMQKEIEKKKTFVGQIIPHKGHTVWQINNETKEITKAEFSNSVYVIGQKNISEIIILEGFSYVSALSKKTALNKFRLNKNGSKQVFKEPIKLT